MLIEAPLPIWVPLADRVAGRGSYRSELRWLVVWPAHCLRTVRSAAACAPLADIRGIWEAAADEG